MILCSHFPSSLVGCSFIAAVLRTGSSPGLVHRFSAPSQDPLADLSDINADTLPSQWRDRAGLSSFSIKCLVPTMAGCTPVSVRYLILLTLPMPKGRGFLVRQPLRRLRRIGVLHDFPKREFPCAPRYVLFPFMQLWICLPKPCARCSLQHSHLCRDGFRTLGNPIRGHSNL